VATQADVRAALERVPPDLHRLLFWLVTGREMPVDAKNGAA
jgi:hypothetical protein